jgi:hypothetical protein
MAVDSPEDTSIPSNDDVKMDVDRPEDDGTVDGAEVMEMVSDVFPLDSIDAEVVSKTVDADNTSPSPTVNAASRSLQATVEEVEDEDAPKVSRSQNFVTMTPLMLRFAAHAARPRHSVSQLPSPRTSQAASCPDALIKHRFPSSLLRHEAAIVDTFVFAENTEPSNIKATHVLPPLEEVEAARATIAKGWPDKQPRTIVITDY